MSVVRKKSRRDLVARDYDTSALSNAPQQRRSQQLSLRILEAAERVLLRDGLQAFTIVGVAAEAGVSVGGIYGRFKHREELLSAIHTETLMKIQHHLEAVADRKFETLREGAEVFAIEVVNLFEEVGSLLPMARRPDSKAEASTVYSVERAIRAAFARVVDPFKSQIKHVDLDIGPRLVVHLLLASTVREAATDPGATDRKMGWDILRRELPRVAGAIMTGVY